MASSTKWATIISTIASYIYLFIVFFQVPLFRIQCSSGMCTTPIEVISSHLMTTKVIPSLVVKSLLYPGTIAKGMINGRDIPRYNKVVKFYRFTNLSRQSFATNFQHLEVLAGSYLSVTGAFISLFKSRRMSFIGTLLIFWGLIRDNLFIKSSSGYSIDQTDVAQIHTTLLLAAASAFLSIRRDVRTLIRIFTTKPLTKSL